MTTNRRDFLRKGAATGGGLFFAGNLTGLFANAPAIASCTPRQRGVGPLIADPAGLLDLPEDFSYSIVSQVGDPLPSGAALADRFDGTAAYSRGRTTVLVRNHEQDTGAASPTVAGPELVYDPVCGGGTSTVEIDRRDGKVGEYISLAGTNNNCAGGSTPWGTWLTCEETEDRAGDADGHTKDHGFVFEVHPIDQALNVNPTPLTALGRYAHEAAIVDPRTGIVYLTEDASRPNGLVYRCLPNRPRGRYGSLREGGVLEAMRCTDGGTFVPDLSAYSAPGTTLTVGWVAVPDPMAMTTPTRAQLPEVTRSRKFEGAWWGDREGYIVASYARNSDGSVGQHDGQVWRFDPRRNTLTLDVHFGLNPDYASDNPDGPDNITVSPWGGLILCEDGEGTQLLQAVSRDGTTVPFARNARDDSEFAGACFGQDRDVLYANLQAPGVTFAIGGPFRRLRRSDDD
ncbi:MAG: alkaline phosphatase PhoX [Ilumatobacteraceae bacterium]